MEKKFEFRQFSILAWAVTLLMFFAALIVFISTDYIYSMVNSTTQQTYLVIFGLSMSLFIIVGINLYFSKIISIAVKQDSIVIDDTKTKTNTILQKKNIENYNFNITRKGILDILRIKLDNRNMCFWLAGISFNQENKKDIKNKGNLRQELKTHLPNKNIKTSSDHIIVFFANKFPFIMLFVALVIFILGLIYIINL
ncbi:hypothetical protein [Chryseobacterium sp. RLHN22]|uniref:hypothetical protein n=1 Tax=Chryseobacterium sp. RLHN22 TaxID=3437885 RepID=UPI003D9B2734